MIRNIIERSALLIALGKTYPNGVKVDRLDEVMKTWRSHCKFLKDRGVNIKIYDDVVVLKSPLYYDLYQSVPPEIRRSIENILWKIVPKETIIDESVVAQKTIQVLDEVLNAFISKLPPSVEQIDADGTKWIIREGERFPIACIHCSDPSCMTYDIKAFGTTDAFSSRVCPAKAIIQTQEGIVEIDKSMCTGCMLCIVRCPVNTISLIEGIATKRGYDQLPDKDKYIKQVTVLIEEKREICADTLEKLGKVSTPLKVDGDIRQILDNFDDNMSITRFNWDQDKYYVFVRNCFRELGLEAIYSGASGKLRRSDVTIKAPFLQGLRSRALQREI